MSKPRSHSKKTSSRPNALAQNCEGKGMSDCGQFMCEGEGHSPPKYKAMP